MLGSTELENSMSEKPLGILVDVKLNTSQPCACDQRRLVGFWASLEELPTLSSVLLRPGLEYSVQP